MMNLPPKDYSPLGEPWNGAQEFDDERIEVDRMPFIRPLLYQTIVVVLFCLLMFGWLFWPREVKAQPTGAPQCAPYGRMTEYLSATFKEKLAGIGIVNPRAIMQLFVAPSGTWTILAVGIDGRACVMASGQGWEQMPPPETGEPS
jgi:hypothetical protein